MTKINKEEYTISKNAEAVKVSTFRNRIDYLLRIVRTDSHACVGKKEKAQCVRFAKDAGSELIATDCNRATKYDWDRREEALDISFSFISKSQHMSGIIV